jgi:hypothetical protein
LFVIGIEKTSNLAAVLLGDGLGRMFESCKYTVFHEVGYIVFNLVENSFLLLRNG